MNSDFDSGTLLTMNGSCILQEDEEPDVSNTAVALLTSGAEPLRAVEGDIVFDSVPRLPDLYVQFGVSTPSPSLQNTEVSG